MTYGEALRSINKRYICGECGAKYVSHADAFLHYIEKHTDKDVEDVGEIDE